MIGLCLGLAGVVWAHLPVSAFTLAWDHTIEKTRWEEDYLVTEHGLVLKEARIVGNGAGMEIPQGAQLEKGRWRYHPELPTLQQLNLGRTPEAGDYQVCLEDNCHPVSEWVGPPDAGNPFIQLWACPPGDQ